MKKTLNIDERLLAEAREASKAGTDTETVKLGLEALVRHAAYQRLAALRGSEKGQELVDGPRRREDPDPARAGKSSDKRSGKRSGKHSGQLKVA